MSLSRMVITLLFNQMWKPEECISRTVSVIFMMLTLLTMSMSVSIRMKGICVIPKMPPATSLYAVHMTQIFMNHKFPADGIVWCIIGEVRPASSAQWEYSAMFFRSEIDTILEKRSESLAIILHVGSTRSSCANYVRRRPTQDTQGNICQVSLYLSQKKAACAKFSSNRLYCSNNSPLSYRSDKLVVKQRL
jgi:hypothetical protein